MITITAEQERIERLEQRVRELESEIELRASLLRALEDRAPPAIPPKVRKVVVKVTTFRMVEMPDGESFDWLRRKFPDPAEAQLLREASPLDLRREVEGGWFEPMPEDAR